MSIFELMAAPFAECMILVVIHTYLGIHVLRRRVIFVDLALAQTAALGTTVGFLFGIMPETSASLIFSLTFTFIAAAVFALTRIRSDRVPQEAIIGLFYAIAAAMAVLVVEKTKGAEHMESILVGGLLWVKWSDVAAASIAYSAIGVVHWVLRKQFRMISERPDEAYERGMNVRFWDFLFYMTFGFVITFSVRVAGVLLVFVFLVAPAIMALLITDRMRYQLLIGWITGTVVTAVGLFISYVVDLPSGPTVVAFYGIVLVFGALAVYVIRARERSRALVYVGVGVIVAFIVGGAVWAEGMLLAGSGLALDDKTEMMEEMARKEKDQDAKKEFLEHEIVGEMAHLRKVTGAAAGDGEILRYLALEDSESRLDFIRRKIEIRPDSGFALIICFLSDPESGVFFRSEALDLLRGRFGDDFGYDPEKTPGDNSAAIERMRKRLVSSERERARGRSPRMGKNRVGVDL
jgi:zinc/manganese transport system permease protein